MFMGEATLLAEGRDISTIAQNLLGFFLVCDGGGDSHIWSFANLIYNDSLGLGISIVI